jgi:hypothetical protein
MPFVRYVRHRCFTTVDKYLNTNVAERAQVLDSLATDIMKSIRACLSSMEQIS